MRNDGPPGCGFGLSRRRFMALAGAVAIGLAGAGATRRPFRARSHRPDPDLYFDWLTPRIKWLRIASGPGGNTLIILGAKDDGAIVVDTQVSPLGATVRRDAEILGNCVLQVINSHHHEGNTGGNHAFTKDVPVLTHAAAKPRIIAQLNRYRSQIKEFVARGDGVKDTPAGTKVVGDWKELHGRIARLTGDDFAPTRTLDADATALEIGGRKLVLHHLGPGHTDNDLVVQLPDDNIVHTGGLVSFRVHPEIDRAGGCSTSAWLAALDRLEKLCDSKTLVIPAEGAPANIAAIHWQRDYLQTLRSAVIKAIDQHKPRADVRALRPNLKVPPKSREGHEDRLALSLDAVFDEVTAERTPPPSAPPTPRPGG